MISQQKNKIYSKTLGPKQARIFDASRFANLSDFRGEANSVFMYDEHDMSMRNVPFSKMMDEEHWNFYQATLTSKIFVNFSSDYINLRDLERIYETIQFRKIDTSRIYILVMDQNYVDFVNEYFNQRNITDIKVGWYNIWLKKTPFLNLIPNDLHARFSAFSRNFNKWRLRLFTELQDRGLLNEFKYSFGTRNPYSGDEFNKDRLVKLLSESGFTKTISQTTDAWLSGAPYLLDEGSDKFSSVTNNTMMNCGIHILIESHYDPFATDQSARDYGITVESYSPGFPTEKTWKVLSCAVPFIAFTTPYFLKDLKKLGFKTYSPFIDESYDLIEDNEKRLNAILDEITRLSNMGESEFKILLSQLAATALFNREHVFALQKNVEFSGHFKFIDAVKAKFAEYSNVRL